MWPHSSRDVEVSLLKWARLGIEAAGPGRKRNSILIPIRPNGWQLEDALTWKDRKGTSRGTLDMCLVFIEYIWDEDLKKVNESIGRFRN